MSNMIIRPDAIHRVQIPPINKTDPIISKAVIAVTHIFPWGQPFISKKFAKLSKAPARNILVRACARNTIASDIRNRCRERVLYETGCFNKV